MTSGTIRHTAILPMPSLLRCRASSAAKEPANNINARNASSPTAMRLDQPAGATTITVVIATTVALERTVSGRPGHRSRPVRRALSSAIRTIHVEAHAETRMTPVGGVSSSAHHDAKHSHAATASTPEKCRRAATWVTYGASAP
jgi:hypothetical protein